MKRRFLGSLLGMASSVVIVASAYGQGQVIFSTYVGTVYQPIRYSEPVPGNPLGDIVGPGFSAELFYGFGSGLTFDQLTALPSSITPVGTQVPGYVTDGAVTIPDYSSGPVTFAIVAFNGADWFSTLGNSSGLATWPSQVVTWTEPSIAIPPNPADYFSQNVPPIVIGSIPEPSLFALLGLGGIALLLAVAHRKRAFHAC